MLVLKACKSFRFGRSGLDPEKVDELKVEFCPIIRSRTNEEKSIQ